MSQSPTDELRQLTHSVSANALATLGDDAITIKAIETLSELITGLARLPTSVDRNYSVITEIAEAWIVINELRLMMGSYEVDKAIEFRLYRLRSQIKLGRRD